MSFAEILTLISRNKARLSVMLLMCGLYFFAYFQRIAVPGTVFNELQRDFSASAAAVTMLGAISLYIYASLQMVTGVLSDRFGAARILLAGSVVLTAGSFLFPLAHSMTVLYISRALIGLGAAFIYVSMVKEIDQLFDSKDFAMILSTAIFLGYTGGLTGTYPLERAVSLVGWRTSFLAAGVACLIVLVAAAWLFKKANRLQPPGNSFTFGRIHEIVTNFRALPLVFCGGMIFSLYFLFQAVIGKKMLQDCFGLSSVAAAGLIFAMMLANMFAAASSGFVSKIIGNRRRPLMIGVHIILIASCLLMLAILNDFLTPKLLFLCCILFGISGCGSPIFCTAMKEVNPPDSAGTSIGYINGAAYVFVAVVATLAGFCLDLFRSQTLITPNAIIYPVSAYNTVMIGVTAIAVISTVLCMFVQETKGTNVYKQKASSCKDSTPVLVNSTGASA